MNIRKCFPFMIYFLKHKEELPYEVTSYNSRLYNCLEKKLCNVFLEVNKNLLQNIHRRFSTSGNNSTTYSLSPKKKNGF